MSDGSAAYPRLVGDVGGTSARFGWVEAAGAGVTRLASYHCDAYAGLEAVVVRYLANQGLASPPAAAIGIATPVTGDQVAMTNRDWSFSISALQQRLGLQRLVVLNDFAALALALPDLAPAELHAVGGGAGDVGAARALLGAGTGLGVSGLLPAAGGYVPVVGEGGHATLAGANADQDRVIERLRQRYGHVSAERVLSGPGLVDLYEVCCEFDGVAAQPLDPPDVSARALQGTDAQCRAAVELFFDFLGSVAGNLALILGARGGVYIGGGIVPELGDWISRSRFRERFEAKGRFRAYLASIPVWVVTASGAPALRGANRALDPSDHGAQNGESWK